MVRTPHLRRSRRECVLIARVLNLNPPACRRSIRRAFVPHELPSLIEAIFSSEDEGGPIRPLLDDNTQIFIDVIDEARSTYVRSSSQTR